MDLEKQIKQILNSYKEVGGINQNDGCKIPSKSSIQDILKLIKNILFPGYFIKEDLSLHNIEELISSKVYKLSDLLSEEITRSFVWLQHVEKQPENTREAKEKAIKITKSLLENIPAIRETLKTDVTAHYQGDPAAKSHSEIILAYPGFTAIMVHRIAHFLLKHNVPLIPRLMSEIVHSETGIDIHPGATIGSHFCIDHGTGIVIGETAIIGDQVKLYQGVTIGALSVDKSLSSVKRHPTIEENVTIYARTTILGGETIIGKNSIIGGNLWIIESIPQNSKVYIAADKYQIKTS